MSSEVFSATSFSELARDAREVQRHNRLHPGQPRTSHLQTLLPGDVPIVAATDYVRAWPQLIAEYLDAPYITLGTDGFGRSDTRQQLRGFSRLIASTSRWRRYRPCTWAEASTTRCCWPPARAWVGRPPSRPPWNI